MFVSLAAAVDELGALDVATLADDEVAEAVVVLAGLRARVEAVEAELAASFDARKAYAPSGAKTARAWIAAHTREPASEVGGRVWLGRKLRDLPEPVASAWRAGEIGDAHVRRLAGVWNERTAARFDRDVDVLVDQATRLGWFDFSQCVEYWFHLADEDGASAKDVERRARRTVHLSESIDGLWFGSLTLDPLAGTIVAGELGRLTDELFRNDWAKAEAELGRAPQLHELGRAPEQRRADALAEMARRSRSLVEGAAKVPPLFTVLVGEDTFTRTCELAGGHVLAPEMLASWLWEAVFERVVFDGPSRVIDVSRRRRFTGALRRAVEVRDRRCYHPTCDEPADRCQVDHIVAWSDGGPTSQDNGRLACGHHNRWSWTTGDNQRPPPLDDG